MNTITKYISALVAATIVGSGIFYLVNDDPVGRTPQSSDASKKPEVNGAIERHRISGYPLDRRLEALVKDSDSQEIFIVEKLKAGKTVDLTRPGTGADASPTTIITPVSGLVTEVLRGDLRPEVISPKIPILGGQVDNKAVEASPKIAPDITDLLREGGRFLVAGLRADYPELGGDTVDASFIYKLNDDGTATSLLESGSEDPFPSFDMEDLRKQLLEIPLKN